MEFGNSPDAKTKPTLPHGRMQNTSDCFGFFPYSGTPIRDLRTNGQALVWYGYIVLWYRFTFSYRVFSYRVEVTYANRTMATIDLVPPPPLSPPKLFPLPTVPNPSPPAHSYSMCFIRRYCYLEMREDQNI